MEYTVGGRARDAEICLHLLGADDWVSFQDQGYSLRFAGFGLSPSHRIAMGNLFTVRTFWQVKNADPKNHSFSLYKPAETFYFCGSCIKKALFRVAM